MSAAQLFSSAWSWNPWLVAAGILVLLAPGLSAECGSRGKMGWLLAALVLLFLTLASPLAALAEGYLFSAHMLQHLLLLLIIPPLLLLSRAPLLPARGRNWLLGCPIVTWFLGLGGMWIWHARTLCNAAATNGWVHDFQSLSLLLMGLAFWWPILGPRPPQRLSAPAGIVYLFSACVGCTVLGIILTFSPVEVCSIYLHPTDGLGILPLLQNDWGLTPAKDQQLGGLLMWVPACLIYLGGILGLLFRWYGEKNEEAVVSRPFLTTETNAAPLAAPGKPRHP